MPLCGARRIRQAAAVVEEDRLPINSHDFSTSLKALVIAGASNASYLEAKDAAWLTLPPTPALPSTTRTDVITVNGTPIFFAQFGEGPEVLLLHGGLANSNYWGYQVQELAKMFSVTVMDTRGHGRSPLRSRHLSYEIFADDVSGLLDLLKIPAVSIIGWSDGAITGLQLAMNQPNRVSKLFAFGANSSVDGLKKDTSRTRVFASFVARCKTEYAQLSPHPEKWSLLMDSLRVMWRSEPNFTKRRLASLNIPTTLSDGDHDEIIKSDHTKQIADEIPGARLVIQHEVSHFAMLQNPRQFNETVIDFLKK